MKNFENGDYMKNPKFIKVVKITHPVNWWNCDYVLNQTFEVLDVVNNRAKIEHLEGYYGYVP